MFLGSGLEYMRMDTLETDINSLVCVKINLKNKDPILDSRPYQLSLHITTAML